MIVFTTKMTASKLFVSIFALCLGSSQSFTVPSASFVFSDTSSLPSSRTSIARFSTTTGEDQVEKMAMEANGDGSEEVIDPLDADAVWAEQLKSEEVQEVRVELIQKYLQMGMEKDKAEAEIDAFLSDRERSLQYLEMRRYAAAQADELGPELILQLGGAFVIGLAATVGVKYFNAYKSVYPDGNGPIPFL